MEKGATVGAGDEAGLYSKDPPSSIKVSGLSRMLLGKSASPVSEVSEGGGSVHPKDEDPSSSQGPRSPGLSHPPNWAREGEDPNKISPRRRTVGLKADRIIMIYNLIKRHKSFSLLRGGFLVKPT